MISIKVGVLLCRKVFMYVTRVTLLGDISERIYLSI